MNAKVRVEVTTQKQVTAGKPVTVALRIEDDLSGEVLAVVDFTADEWLELMSGSSKTMEGLISNHLERVGRKMVVRSVPIPREATPGFSEDERKKLAFAWAQDLARTGETTSVRSTNSGWEAIYRSWPDVA